MLLVHVMQRFRSNGCCPLSPPPATAAVVPLLSGLPFLLSTAAALQAVVNSISLRHQQEQAADERRHVYG